MNVFVVLSLDSGLPVFHRQTPLLELSTKKVSVTEKLRSERDIMHVASLLYALRKISASIDSSNVGNIPAKHRLGQLHHMQQGTEHVYSFDFFIHHTTSSSISHFCAAMVLNQVDYSTDFGCYVMSHITKMLIEDEGIISVLQKDNNSQQNNASKKIWKTFLDTAFPMLAWQRMQNILHSTQHDLELSVQFLASKQSVQNLLYTSAEKEKAPADVAVSPAAPVSARKEEIRGGEQETSRKTEISSSSSSSASWWCCFGGNSVGSVHDAEAARGKKTSVVEVHSRNNPPSSSSISHSPTKSAHSRESEVLDDDENGDCVVLAFPNLQQAPADKHDLTMWYNAIMAVIYQQLDGHFDLSATMGEMRLTKIQLMDQNMNMSFKLVQKSHMVTHMPAPIIQNFGESSSAMMAASSRSAVPAAGKKSDEVLTIVSLDEDDPTQSIRTQSKPPSSPEHQEESFVLRNHDNDLIFYLLDCHDLLGLVRCRNQLITSSQLQSVLQEVSQAGRWLLWCLQQRFIAVDPSVLSSAPHSVSSKASKLIVQNPQKGKEAHSVGVMYLERELQ